MPAYSTHNQISGRIGNESRLQNRGHYNILLILFFGLSWNILLISTPGFFSHDELDWRNRIARNLDPWTFGLGDFVHSPFFRPIGTIIISAWLRIPIQPIGSHLAEVVLSVATACLIYKLVSLYSPERALAASFLFMLTPGFAFSAGWIAAGFDILYTLFGVLCILSAVLYWRGGHIVFLTFSMLSFLIALGCKETALSIPVCAAIVMFIDRHEIDRRRAGIFAAFMTMFVLLYLAFGVGRILRVAASGEGGYKFGSAANALSNMVPYFGFQFAPRMMLMQEYAVRNPAEFFRFAWPHCLLLALILWKGGPKWLFIYIIAFYATLLPVLPISKYETQYAYAGSIAIAVALAMLWDRRWTVAVPVALLTLLLVFHNFRLQRMMYEVGGCQTRALDTVQASLMSLAPAGNSSVLIAYDTPGWVVLARALHDNSFSVHGAFEKVSITTDAKDAAMVFNGDCSVSVRSAL